MMTYWYTYVIHDVHIPVYILKRHICSFYWNIHTLKYTYERGNIVKLFYHCLCVSSFTLIEKCSNCQQKFTLYGRINLHLSSFCFKGLHGLFVLTHKAYGNLCSVGMIFFFLSGDKYTEITWNLHSRYFKGGFNNILKL